MTDNKETVVVTDGGSGGGWFMAGILAVGLVVLGFLVYNGFFTGGQSDSVQVELNVPEALTPDN